MQTQLQVYSAYDKENLYLCFNSPVYPENSWLKARARFPDVLHHPLYGVLWDDHLELELRPYHDNARGFQYGLFRWDVNPMNAFCDWYWSIDGGTGMKWKSNAKIRSQATGKRWIVEYAIPLPCFLHANYLGKDEEGKPLVTIPPPDETAYRAWFVRGIGGNGAFFNAYDAHVWNTTKTKIIFDSEAPSFQVNELGPIMEDVIDLEFTVKNHSQRSQTVRVGFFVESEEGLVYSSYDAPELKDGLVELVPGVTKTLRLKKPFPGISTDGNVLWFDVRSAGQPAKTLFLTRLVRFHAVDGGVTRRGEEPWPFRERRLEIIKELRPPRETFTLTYDISAYHRRLAAMVDKGVHGANEETRRAQEAKLLVLKETRTRTRSSRPRRRSRATLPPSSWTCRSS